MRNVANSEQSGFLTAEQLAKRLGNSVNTLWNWRSQGVGPAYIKLGNTPKSPVRYRLSDVIAWENSLVRIVPSVGVNATEAYERL